MNISDLIPILEAAHQRDQLEFSRLKAIEINLEREFKELLNFASEEPVSAMNYEGMTLLSKHTNWRRLKAEEAARAIFEMKPSINEAKRRLAISFGRLEALRATSLKSSC